MRDMRDAAWYAGISGGVLALGIGTSLVTATIASVVHERDRLRTEAAQARPAPTVTVTRTAPGSPVAAPSQSPSAAAGPSLVPAGSVSGRTGRDVPVAAQSGPSPRPQTPVPGGSSPAPGTGSSSPARGCAPVSVCMRLGISPAITIKGR